MTFVPLLDHGATQIAAATTACFEGYVVDVRFDAASFDQRFFGEGLDRCASTIAFDGAKVAGIVLVVRRGWTARIAGMGVAPAHRGAGVGSKLVARVVERARARGDRRLVLEVLEQNEAALRLYRKAGFHATRRLVGYRRSAARGAGSELLKEIDPVEVAAEAVAFGESALPWPLQPATLASATAPAAAYRLGPAVATILPTAAATLIIALLVAGGDRRRGNGARIVEALGSLRPKQPLFVPQVVPDDLAPGFFAACGFRPDPLTQLEMQLVL